MQKLGPQESAGNSSATRRITARTQKRKDKFITLPLWLQPSHEHRYMRSHKWRHTTVTHHRLYGSKTWRYSGTYSEGVTDKYGVYMWGEEFAQRWRSPPASDRRGKNKIYLSWPAVSQSWSAIVLPSTHRFFIWKSTPETENWYRQETNQHALKLHSLAKEKVANY